MVSIQRQHNGTVELIAQGEIDLKQAKDLFQVGLTELHDSSCQELIVDLSETQLLNNSSLFKLYKLLDTFNDLPDDDRTKRIQVVYGESSRNLHSLEKAVLMDGINLQFSSKICSRVQ